MAASAHNRGTFAFARCSTDYSSFNARDGARHVVALIVCTVAKVARVRNADAILAALISIGDGAKKCFPEIV